MFPSVQAEVQGWTRDTGGIILHRRSVSDVSQCYCVQFIHHDPLPDLLCVRAGILFNNREQQVRKHEH